MRSLFLAILLGWGTIWAQSASGTPASNSQSSPPSSAPSNSPPSSAEPPRSDRVNVGDLGDTLGESSSKDTQVDLSPPSGDDKTHPESAGAVTDAEKSAGTEDISEARLWNPHKAAKDIEVGDFYFKRKNYRAAEDRYREALLYKQNDASATFRLAESLEKLDLPVEARQEYESYLRILPNGPQAPAAKKALERLKSPRANNKPSP